MPQEPPKKPPHTQFKASQLTFNLPEEMHEELKGQLERAQAQENVANKKAAEFHEKEKALEENRKRMEQEKTKLRSQFQAQMDTLQKRFGHEQELSKNEVARLNKELQEAQNECGFLRHEQGRVVEDYQKEKSKLEDMFSTQEGPYRKKFESLTQKIQTVTAVEREFLKRKKKDLKRSKQKSEAMRKASADQVKKSDEIDAAYKGMEKTTKKYKARLNEQYATKVEELEKEFNLRMDYHNRRLDEAREEEALMEQEREKLRIKEKTVSLEVRTQLEERLKEEKDSLAKREKAWVKNKKDFAAEEIDIINQRRKLMAVLNPPKKSQTTLAQLESLAKSEEETLHEKNKILKSLQNYRASMDKEVQKTIKTYEQEKDRFIAEIETERKQVVKERDQLRKIEERLVARETEEIKRLNEEYEDAKQVLSVDQIVQEAELEKQWEKLREAERKLLKRQKQQQENETKTGQRIEEQEDQAIEELDEIQQLKEDLLMQQLDMNEFLGKFQTSYKERLELQNQEYDHFKKKIDTMNAETEQWNQALHEKGKSAQETSEAAEQATTQRLRERESMINAMEKELRKKVEEYQIYVKELQKTKKDIMDKDQSRQSEFMENLNSYEDKLLNLGKSFEELSTTFHAEVDAGTLEIVGENDSDEELVIQWPFAVRVKLDPDSVDFDRAKLVEYVDKASKKWGEWISIPPGEYWMGNQKFKGEAPYKQMRIEKQISIAKYPLTNAQFYQFVLATNYKTEAESALINGIVYHDGRHPGNGSGKKSKHSYSNPTLTPEKSARWISPNGHPESLFDKCKHPVTQVTWKDAEAYCLWQSEVLGQTIRLPSESEWEYVARNFGELAEEEFFWKKGEIKNFCNIQETGVGDTTAVDFFPEQDVMGGVQDLFGNVYEWVLDSRDQNSSKVPTGGLEYKMARGGSFITNYQHIAPWRRLPFAINYCTSFLGFRVVREEN